MGNGAQSQRLRLCFCRWFPLCQPCPASRPPPWRLGQRQKGRRVDHQGVCPELRQVPPAGTSCLNPGTPDLSYWRLGVRIRNLPPGRCACCIDVGGVVHICPGKQAVALVCLRTLFPPHLSPDQEPCKCFLFSFEMETDKSLKNMDRTLGQPPSVRRDGGFPPIPCTCVPGHMDSLKELECCLMDWTCSVRNRNEFESIISRLL